MTPDMQQFLQDRDAALRSLDKTRILAYYRKYGEGAMADFFERPGEDGTFWAAVHRARLTIASFTDAEKAVSREWLSAHGFEPRGL